MHAMSIPQGLATYPGIEQIVSASVTLGHGISPSVIRISVIPQATPISEVGTFTLFVGSNIVTLPDCKIDYGSYQRQDSGELWNIALIDRRWKWRFGQISGRYNVRREDAKLQNGDPLDAEKSELVVDTERTARQLATMYLDAMGETDYDVSLLPEDARPAVEHDYDNPAQALATLCDGLGYRVVLRLDNTVKIVQLGEGGELPNDFLLEDGRTFNPPEIPDSIAVVCGPSAFQVDFPLEAVGVDRDVDSEDKPTDTIKPIEQLSYRPAGGWATADLPFLTNVTFNSSEEDVSGLRSLATKSVFRYYRIKMPVNIPGYAGPTGSLVTKREQILPIFEEQVVTVVENDQAVPLPAAVFGVWYPGLDDPKNTSEILMVEGNSTPAIGNEGEYKSQFYNRGFTIDTARGMVIFDEPVFKNATPNLAKVTPVEAQLVLRAKCHVREDTSLALVRHVHTRSTSSTLGTQPLYLKHDELFVTHVPTYDASKYALTPDGENDPRTITSVANTTTEINETCDHYINATLATFTKPEPHQIRAAGIWPVDLDGAIEQVTYQVGTSGATTTVSRGSEPVNAVLGHRERRRAEIAEQQASNARLLRADLSGRNTRIEAASRRTAR